MFPHITCKFVCNTNVPYNTMHPTKGKKMHMGDTDTKTDRNRQREAKKIVCDMWMLGVRCQVPYVRCHMPSVMGRVSPVTCHMKISFLTRSLHSTGKRAFCDGRHKHTHTPHPDIATMETECNENMDFTQQRNTYVPFSLCGSWARR